MNLTVMKGIAGALMMALSTTALAADYPKVIQNILGAGLKVEKSFPAASDMTGWVLSRQGQYMIVYTSPDKKTLLSGVLVDENGKNLTAGYTEQYVPKPDLGTIYKMFEKATFIVEGEQNHPKRVLYAFFDPNCPYCHLTWKALQPYEKAGLQVRWLPIAELTPTSLPKAISILEAKDKVAAFRKGMENYGKAQDVRLDPSKLDPRLIRELRNNGVLMRKFGIQGTPGLVWKDKSGKVQVKPGMPPMSEFPAITGLPKQRVVDSTLPKSH